MPFYRLYRLDAVDHIKSVEQFRGKDDEAAIAEAVRLDHAAVIEIWTGKRKVARVDPTTGEASGGLIRKSPAG
jgi:hypothetical protein